MATKSVNPLGAYETLDCKIKQFIDDIDPDCVYVCQSLDQGALVSEEKWLIIRIKKIAGLTYIGLADNSVAYIKIPNSRATYTYFGD